MSIRLSSSSLVVACGGLMMLGSLSLSGCQTTMNGQTLPSPTYLRDDVQFFPAGPEFLLPNQVQAIEEYRAAQASFEGDVQP